MKAFEAEKFVRKNPPAVELSCDCRFAVVIPVYDELEFFPETMASLYRAIAECGEKIAVIAVINYPPGASPEESGELYRQINAGVYPGVLPVFVPEIRGGVGAARKCGMDAFIAAIPPDEMEKSAIFSLDADTLVSPDYFVKLLPEVLKGGALSIGFAHRTAESAAHCRAMAAYEAYLTRYVENLRYAGSPYAFYTVGSAFAVRCDAYIRAGGMKVREAGEDFYFLQEAAKSSGVRSIAEKLVFPSPRLSERVPFGTGRAVAAQLKGEALNEIPDEAFGVLKTVLTVRDEKLPCSAADFLSFLPERAAGFFVREHFPEVWEKILNNLPDRPDAAAKAFDRWFDGLKTLRFLHFLM
jgi:hypothetical protein